MISGQKCALPLLTLVAVRLSTVFRNCREAPLLPSAFYVTVQPDALSQPPHPQDLSTDFLAAFACRSLCAASRTRCWLGVLARERILHTSLRLCCGRGWTAVGGLLDLPQIFLTARHHWHNNVFNVSSNDRVVGEQWASINVRQLPPNESLSSLVNFGPKVGRLPPFWPSALMTFPRASRCAPSCNALLFFVSAALSEPARSSC